MSKGHKTTHLYRVKKKLNASHQLGIFIARKAFMGVEMW